MLGSDWRRPGPGFEVLPSEILGSKTYEWADAEFLVRIGQIVWQNISDPGFDTFEAAREASISRMQLNRRLQGLTGHPTREFIRLLRLHHAYRLLARHGRSVSEVSRFVGFRSVSHFARAFKSVYGVSPSSLNGRKGWGRHTAVFARFSDVRQ